MKSLTCTDTHIYIYTEYIYMCCMSEKESRNNDDSNSKYENVMTMN